jgi:hypothetical protein
VRRAVTCRKDEDESIAAAAMCDLQRDHLAPPDQIGTCVSNYPIAAPDLVKDSKYKILAEGSTDFAAAGAACPAAGCAPGTLFTATCTGTGSAATCAGTGSAALVQEMVLRGDCDAQRVPGRWDEEPGSTPGTFTPTPATHGAGAMRTQRSPDADKMYALVGPGYCVGPNAGGAATGGHAHGPTGSCTSATGVVTRATEAACAATATSTWAAVLETVNQRYGCINSGEAGCRALCDAAQWQHGNLRWGAQSAPVTAGAAQPYDTDGPYESGSHAIDSLTDHVNKDYDSNNGPSCVAYAYYGGTTGCGGVDEAKCVLYGRGMDVDSPSGWSGHTSPILQVRAPPRLGSVSGSDLSPL